MLAASAHPTLTPQLPRHLFDLQDFTVHQPLVVLPLLPCPIGEGLMMRFMTRGGRRQSSSATALLRVEVAASGPRTTCSDPSTALSPGQRDEAA